MVGPQEPTWTDEDRAKVIAFLSWSAGTCSGCGMREEDWLDPITKRDLPELNVVPELRRCLICEETADIRSRLGKSSYFIQWRPRREGESYDPNAIPRVEEPPADTVL